jgi:hypothetical protein
MGDTRERLEAIILACEGTVETHWEDRAGDLIVESPLQLAHDLRALLALPQPDGWRPIEEAPRDGTPFLAIVDSGLDVRRVSWGKTSHVPIYGFCLRDQGPEDSDLCSPTHWMPLPPPPVSSSTGENGDG